MARVARLQQGFAAETPKAEKFPPRLYAIFVIAILMVATFQAQLDRQLPSLLVAPIRHAFAINDTEISFFQGAAFAVFYAVMGPVFGALVDRSNRRNLIVAGILAWSVMTIWSGLATDFWQLLVSRMGVGIGEAVLAPAAYSLIADYVEPQIRGRALTIYMASVAVGSGASLALGGAVIGTLSNAGPIVLPVLGRLAPWQLAFVIAGAPGLFAALLVFLVREVPRLENGSAASGETRRSSFAEFFHYVRAHSTAFTYLVIAQVAAQFTGNALFSWLPTFFLRTYHLPIRSTGLVLGLMLAGCSGSGFILSGTLSDWLSKRGDLAGRLRPMVYAELSMIPLLIAWPLAGNAMLSFVLLGILMVVHAGALGTLPTTIQEITPNRMRGQAVTYTLMIAMLLGWGFGPTVTALFTDYVFHNDAAIGYSLVLSTVPGTLIALFCAWRGMKSYARARESFLATL